MPPKIYRGLATEASPKLGFSSLGLTEPLTLDADTSQPAQSPSLLELPPAAPALNTLTKTEALRQVYLSLAKGSTDSCSKLIINVSGGKDGLSTLLIARYEMDLEPEQIIVHHQILPEAWPGTVEYIGEICHKLGVTFWSDQCLYTGYECQNCKNRYTSIKTDKFDCPKCKFKGSGLAIATLQGVLDIAEFRGKFPSKQVRWCTDYTKIRVFNSRMKQELATIGPNPVTILGERWRESHDRQSLPWLRERPKFNTQTVRMLEFRPILDYRRIDCFLKLRQYGIQPHYAYSAQGMTEHQMYEVDEEGGPRCSCVMCIFSQAIHVRQAYKLLQVKPIIDRALGIEQASGYLWKPKQALSEALLEPVVTSTANNGIISLTDYSQQSNQFTYADLL
jgi:3'-phosphoadenosine 5'-phosphosulfate sulfotransferase (PAPS reductase)/FAD synthetase